MTEQQQYRVIADRTVIGDKIDFETWDADDLLVYRYPGRGNNPGELVRIERPVPTTDEPSAASQVREPLDTEELRCRAAELEEAGWSDIFDAQNAAVPVFYAAADEIDALRAKHPSLPKREEIANVLAGHYAWGAADEEDREAAGAVLALLQKGAERG